MYKEEKTPIVVSGKVLKNKEHNSGQGGSNYASGVIINPLHSNTELTGNGKILIEYVGDSL